MKSRGRRFLNTLLLGACLLAMVGGVIAYQHSYFTGLRGARVFEEKIYLPDSQKLEIASLGFKNLYADLLWLRAIQAFGGRWQTSGTDMGPIFHYFDVITDLDPQFIEAYKLGNLVIGDEGGDYQRSLDILRKGMTRNPGDWELPYLGIYNAVWQMNDLDQARWFAFMASRVPDRPEFVARMREYIERKTGSYDVAYRMNLQYMLRYLDRGDSIESKLTSIRFWDILDRWYKSKLIEAARRFIALKGRDPHSLEELVKSKVWESFRAPTMESIRDTIASYRQKGMALEPHYEEIAHRAVVEIDGVPPEPNGYGYLIFPPEDRSTTSVLEATAQNAFTLPDAHFGYIMNKTFIVSSLTDYVIGMNMEIQKFQQQHGRWPEDMEELVNGSFNYTDPLGGKFIYNPETGEFKDAKLEEGLREREAIYIE